MAESASFELAFEPNFELVSVVRKIVSEFYDRITTDAEAVSRIALATQELLENAVKYSLSPKAVLRVEVRPNVSPPAVMVQSWNHATPEHREKLRRTVATLQEADDPLALYITMMRETAKRQDGSELGLVRIMVEAEMRIDLHEQEERVGISACTAAWAEAS